jgi:SAM-dependent methyltransferase
MTTWALPAWAEAVLAEPGGGAPVTIANDRIFSAKGEALGFVEAGVVHFGVPQDDPSIRFYQSVGGANFQERAKVGYAMGSLDTPVYADYLKLIRPAGKQALVADIGAGDGRNALPWLAETDARLVLVDPIPESLARFGQRLAQEHPEWLGRVLLVKGDARRIPLRTASFNALQSIEALYYLNEDYEIGLGECRRLLSETALLLISDRDYEGGLLLQLLYFDGVAGMLKQAGSRDIWDGSPGNLVRSRCFTREELVETAERCGLHVLEQHGISAMSLVLSSLRGAGKVGSPQDERRLPEVHALLKWLGRNGGMMRSHVLVCRRA